MTTDIDRGGIDVGGAHEPSYYEIALTNRQVVVAFVILLTCVVAAFFSGVWIGRESSARAQERLALLARGHAGHGADHVDAMGNPAGDKDRSEGQALQEFKFFADSRRHPGAPGATGPDTKGTPAATEPASTANSADTTTPAPVETQRSRPASPPVSPATSQATGGGTAGRPGHPAAGASSPGAAPAARAAAAMGAAPGDDTPAGEGEPLPASPAPGGRHASTGAGTAATKSAAATGQSGSGRPAASAPATGTSGSGAGGTAATAAGEVVIQVFSTADREQADRVRDGLADAGFAAFLSPIAKGAQTMYRVRIGPFASRSDAEAVAEKVRKERKLDTWITPK